MGNGKSSIKTSEKRTTLTIDQDTKLVFDWAMKNHGAKSVSKYWQHLLLTEQQVNEPDK